jgi:dynein heavy chain
LVRIEESDHNTKNPILRSKAGHLESNFDRSLLKIMKEVGAWKKLVPSGVVIMSYADDLYTNQREINRVLREYVMLVVRDYNMIIDSMDETEKKLFKEHLTTTEKVIAPGHGKLKWSNKTVL